MLSKFYCQLCKVGTENKEVFATHLLSLGHKIQKMAYERNPSVYTEFMSVKFARQFMEVLYKNFGTKAADINDVYLVYSSDSSLVRLTNTKWTTLDDFLQWLHDSFRDKCSVVNDNSKVTVQILDLAYFNSLDRRFRRNHPQVLREHHREPKVDEQSTCNQVSRARTAETISYSEDDPFNLNGLIDDAFSVNKKDALKDSRRPTRKWTLKRSRITISINPQKERMLKNYSKSKGQNGKDVGLNDSASSSSNDKYSNSRVSPSRQIALKELVHELETLREKSNRRENWLFPGIQVEVVNSRYGKKYFGKHAVIIEVKHSYTALVKFINEEHCVYTDQRDLQTVIPNIGERVLFVNGGYRGHTGILKEEKGTQDSSKIFPLSAQG